MATMQRGNDRFKGNSRHANALEVDYYSPREVGCCAGPWINVDATFSLILRYCAAASDYEVVANKIPPRIWARQRELGSRFKTATHTAAQLRPFCRSAGTD